MRTSLALVLLAALAGGCTPSIPVRDAFGTSALVPAGDIPPEYAEFNAYDAGANRLTADQICALPYTQLEEKSVEAAPGRIIEARGRCDTHIPLFGEQGARPVRSALRALGLLSP